MTKAQSSGHTGGATRRRGDILEAALLEAAWDELQAAGYPNMTMEGVADRAGTSRAVLYRRWPTKAELVVAAQRRRRPILSGAPPDTGSLRKDVLALLRRMSAAIEESGTDTIFGLLGDYLADADLYVRLSGEVLSIGSDVMSTILERAVARGEAPPGLSPRVATLPTDLFRHELFLYRSPPSDAVIRQIVDDIFLVRVNA